MGDKTVASQLDGGKAAGLDRPDARRARDTRRVAVVGGGVTGLAAANRLVELNPSLEVFLLEADRRLGGVLETVRSEGFLFESGADNFITNVPWAVDLCARIGLKDQLVETSDTHRQAFVVRRGRLRVIPQGFLIMAPTKIWPLLVTPILSPWGKLRLAWEYFKPPKRSDDDESLASFATRRFGRETYQRIVQPLVGGIYSADPEKLSIAATMARFAEMERKHGGLIRGVRREAAAHGGSASAGSGARYSMFVAPRDGLESLTQALAARLPPSAVRLDSPVARITPTSAGGWSIEIQGPTPANLEVDGVVVAAPAFRAAPLLAHFDPELAADLERIRYNGCATVSLGYRRDQIAHPLNGFGFVVPIIEQRNILSGSFCSVKYPGRAPSDFVLLRVFLGGGLQGELVELPEDQLREIAEQELADLLGIRGGPVCCRVNRSPQSMPQYELGHGQLVDRIEARAARWPGLTLAGNAYRGVGIPHCVHSGEQAAEILAARRK